jgi:hypothetical protein
MKKKPVIDYGWTSFKYALLLVIAVVIGITSTYLFYRKKASALYIAEELYKYAIEKGTPVVEKAADDVRKQALKIVREAEKKLVEANKK